jgi:hypothetical protein
MKCDSKNIDIEENKSCGVKLYAKEGAFFKREA